MLVRLLLSSLTDILAMDFTPKKDQFLDAARSCEGVPLRLVHFHARAGTAAQGSFGVDHGRPHQQPCTAASSKYRGDGQICAPMRSLGTRSGVIQDLFCHLQKCHDSRTCCHISLTSTLPRIQLAIIRLLHGLDL